MAGTAWVGEGGGGEEGGGGGDRHRKHFLTGGLEPRSRGLLSLEIFFEFVFSWKPVELILLPRKTCFTHSHCFLHTCWTVPDTSSSRTIQQHSTTIE